MNRNERHREIKQINKKLKWIDTHTDFRKQISDVSFYKITQENIDLLNKKEYPDKKIQDKYDTLTVLWQEVINLQTRLQYLKVGFRDVTKQDVPAI
jgi:hypothetical protein